MTVATPDDDDDADDDDDDNDDDVDDKRFTHSRGETILSC